MSVNAVDQTTGNTTPLAGNTNNLVGNLSALTTNTKSDAVGAINEVNQTKQNATDNNLQTTNKTIVGGINELVSGLTNIGGRFAVVEGTNAAAVEQFTTLPMPSGFDAYNTVILGYTSQYSNDLWYSSNSGVYVDANGANVFVTVKDAGFASKPVKVVLYKFA